MNNEPTLELLYRQVDIDAMQEQVYHAFYVYTDEDGDQWMFSAYPETEAPDYSGGAYGIGFGNLQAEFVPLSEGYDREYYGASGTISYTIAQGSALSGANVMGTLSGVAQLINANSITYLIVTANSNSAVSAVATALGVPLSTIPGLAGAPGINNDLSGIVLNTNGVYEILGSGILNQAQIDMLIANQVIDFFNCFPANTQIQLSDGTQKPIAEIVAGDEVASFHPAQFAGRGGLASQKVVRLFENITDVWVKLSNGIVVTPGHHFLDNKGNFRTIEVILASDSEIISANGEVIKVSGEYIHYSAKTADMFEQAEGYVAQSVGGSNMPHAGELALTPVYN